MTPAPSRRVVMVLGMHRSGTSLLANVLHVLGVDFGARLMAARADNPRGFWEHAGIVALHEEILARLDRAWPGAHASLAYPAGWWREPGLADVKARLRALVAAELDRAGGAWGFKDPRTCRLLPLWQELLRELGARAVPVLALRRPAAVAASLAARDGLSAAEAHLLWLEHVLEPLESFEHGMPSAVDFDEWSAADPELPARRLMAELELPWRGTPAELGAALRAVVAAELRHHAGADGACPEIALEAYRLLRAARAGEPVPPRLLEIGADFARHRELFAAWHERLARLADPELARRPLDRAFLMDDERERWRRAFGAIVPRLRAPGAVPAPGALPRDRPVRAARLRICIVTADFVGPVRNGGIGTAYATLARALAADGHEVTVLYTIAPHTETEPLAHWVAQWAGEAIRFVPLPEAPGLRGTPEESMSWRVWQWLAAQAPFDLVHGHEWRGVLYHALMARRHGLAFAGTTFAVGTHSPHLWHAVPNGRPVLPGDLAVDHMERRSIECADYAISPSAYMLQWLAWRGVVLPARTFVQPYLLPAGRAPSLAGATPRAVEEIAFFGRLERRKGLDLFLEALDLVAPKLAARPRVVFLGKHAEIGGESSAALIARRTAGWTVEVVSGLDTEQALARLQARACVAVVASLVENSPHTVYECLDAGVALLASKVGGIAEIIHEEDRGRVVFEPRAAALAAALERVLAEGAAPARLAFDAGENRRAWLAWHRSLELARDAPRPAPQVWNVEGPMVAVCADAPAREAIARGETPYVLLVARGARPRAGAPEALLRGLLHSGGDACTCLAELEGSAERLSALGGAVAALAAGHRLAAPALLARRAALRQVLDAIPGAAPLSAADLNAIQAALVFAGFEVDTLPEAWFVQAEEQPAALPPVCLDAVPPVLHGLVWRAASPATLAAALEASRAEVQALRASTSWRLTAPLRRLRTLLRGS